MHFAPEIRMVNYITFIHNSGVKILGKRSLSHLWVTTFTYIDLILNIGLLKDKYVNTNVMYINIKLDEFYYF